MDHIWNIEREDWWANLQKQAKLKFSLYYECASMVTEKGEERIGFEVLKNKIATQNKCAPVKFILRNIWTFWLQPPPRSRHSPIKFFRSKMVWYVLLCLFKIWWTTDMVVQKFGELLKMLKGWRRCQYVWATLLTQHCRFGTLCWLTTVVLAKTCNFGNF